MDSSTPLSIAEVIAELADTGKPPTYAAISELSDLNSADIKALDQAWADIAVQRRREIITRLAEIAEDNAILDFDKIFQRCLEDEDDEVRRKAVEGLWESEDPSLIEPFTRLLHGDSSEQVQSAAAVALGKFALLSALGKLTPDYSEKVAGALITVLEDKGKPAEVRRRVLEAAAPLNLPEVREAISDAFFSDDYAYKVSALYAMGKSCDPAWMSILLQELESDENELRYEAAGACGEMGEEEAVSHLAELVNDPDENVRLAAIQALGRIGGEDARELLQQYQDIAEEAVREAVEQAMNELNFGEDPLSFKLF